MTSMPALPEDALDVLNRVSDAVYAVDRNWRLTYLNPAAAAFAQSNAQTLLGRLAWEEFPTLVGTEFQRVALRVMQDGVARTHEDCLPAADVWAEARFYPSASGLTVVMRNRTFKKRAQDKLRFQATVLDTIAEAVIVTSPLGTIEFWNAAAAKLYGWTEQEALGENIQDLTASTAFGPEALTHIDTLRKGDTSGGDFRVRRKDGTDFVAYVSNVPLIDESGELTGIVGVSMDVSFERERETKVRLALAERETLLLELEYERNKLADIFRQAPAFMAVVRGTGHVVEFANEAYQRLIGSRQIIGKPVAEALPDFEEQGFIPFLDKVYNTGVPFRGDNHRMLVQPGHDAKVEERFVDFVYTPLKERDGSISGIFAMGIDVTDRQHLETRLRHAQRMEAVGNLAGGVSHDFNNILTVIQNCSQFLLEEVRPDDPLTADILEIQKAADRAATLTKQLLAFSRRQLLQPKVLNVNAVVDSLKPMLDRLIGEHIGITVKKEPQLGSVKADEGQLEQVIVNLVVNARDAMAKGGSIHIESANAELEEASADEHGNPEPGPYVMLAISDTGSGMTPEVRDKIFEPFFTTKEIGQGTGLGLSTVYGIIQQSKGRILVYSEPGLGTTFKMYLPRYDLEPAPATPARSDIIPGGTETILLVEDDSAVRSLTKRILERGGYQVIDAPSGAEAVVLAKGTPSLRLVLSDLVLPHMLGTEIWNGVAQIRPNAAVLFMSGYTNDDVIRRGLLENEMNFLQKPFTANALLAAVRDALDSAPLGRPEELKPQPSDR